MARLGVIHRHLRRTGRLGMTGGEDGRLLQRAVGRRTPLRNDDHVGTRHIFGMKPDIPSAGGFQRQPVVLQVVAPDQNAKTVVRNEFQRTERGGRFLFSTLDAQIASGGQFLPQFAEFPPGGGTGKRVKHRVEILQFLFTLPDLVGKDLLGGLGLAVFLIIFLRILRCRKRRIQRDGERGTVRIIIIDQFRRRGTPGNGVQVGIDQIRVNAFLLPLGGTAPVLHADVRACVPCGRWRW